MRAFAHRPRARSVSTTLILPHCRARTLIRHCPCMERLSGLRQADDARRLSAPHRNALPRPRLAPPPGRAGGRRRSWNARRSAGSEASVQSSRGFSFTSSVGCATGFSSDRPGQSPPVRARTPLAGHVPAIGLVDVASIVADDRMASHRSPAVRSAEIRGPSVRCPSVRSPTVGTATDRSALDRCSFERASAKQDLARRAALDRARTNRITPDRAAGDLASDDRIAAFAIPVGPLAAV